MNNWGNVYFPSKNRIFLPIWSRLLTIEQTQHQHRFILRFPNSILCRKSAMTFIWQSIARSYTNVPCTVTSYTNKPHKQCKKRWKKAYHASNQVETDWEIDNYWNIYNQRQRHIVTVCQNEGETINNSGRKVKKECNSSGNNDKIRTITKIRRECQQFHNTPRKKYKTHFCTTNHGTQQPHRWRRLR